MECSVIGCPYLEERTGYDYECNLPAKDRELCIKRGCEGCPHNILVDSYTYYVCGADRSSDYWECWNA